jgi:adenosylcobinamide-GDP ribazoletransferase
MSLIRNQYELFLIAVGFLTRIPIPKKTDFSEQKLNHASRYFPAVGWLVGIFTAGLFSTFEIAFSKTIAVIFSLLFAILLTGAFHEDGLIDTADGLGGGWSKDQKLEIMKDSRIGTYGAIAIWFSLSLRLIFLTEIDNTFLAFLIAHPLSRSTATGFLYFSSYVRSDNTSKAKPLAQKQNKMDFLVSQTTGISTLILINSHALLLLGSLIAFGILWGWFLKKQLGGFTGDTLGATQQLSEILIYIIISAIP